NAFPASSCLWIETLPRWRLLNVQVTVSPGPTSIAVSGLPSSQLELVRSQPVLASSATLYPLPGTTLENVCVSPLLRLKVVGLRPPPAVNEKLVFVVSGLGSVTFLATIVPQLLMFTFCGAMKSFIVAVPESPDERLTV